MNKRDMAIAEAVELACWDAHCKGWKEPIPLRNIITSIPVDVEPFCWMVTGCNTKFYGEFAQQESEQEAKHCGGTSKAFPLYTAPPDAASIRRAAIEECAELPIDNADLEAPVGNSGWGEAYQEGWIDAISEYSEAIRALLDKESEPVPQWQPVRECKSSNEACDE